MSIETTENYNVLEVLLDLVVKDNNVLVINENCKKRDL